jgi:hypothetical protein
MWYSTIIMSIAEDRLAEARQRAERTRLVRQARASRHAPRRRTSHTVAAISRALTASSHAPSVS